MATDVRFLQLSPAAGYIKIYARPREYLSANHSHWEGGGGGGGLTGKFVSFYTQFLPLFNFFSPAQDDLHLKT